MTRQCAMASLAVDVRVFAALLYIQNVCMADLAGLVPSKLDRMCANFTDGRTAIVPILSEGLGDNEPSYHQKQ